MTPKRIAAARRRRADGGFVIAMFALTLTGLLVFAGFSVDVGAWYARASQIQRGADAAALAGVVWMPNFPKAEEVALAAAAQNGFVHDDDGPIKVVVTPVASRPERLRVTITDERVDQYFSSLVMEPSSITRRSVAQYVLPVPLGSPRNFLGTGSLATGYNENLWLAVSAWCTNKYDGERYQARFGGLGTSYSPSDCVQNPGPADPDLNNEYDEEGYEFYIDAPVDRTYDMDIILFDARYHTGGIGDSVLSSGDQSYKFSLYSADDTPLDDSDNPLLCERVFTKDTPFEFNYLGRSEWNHVCEATHFSRITPAEPSGRYVLRVQNTANERFAAGSNLFSIVARPTSGFGPNQLCDGRSAPLCPRVYGKDSLPVFAKQSSATANFYLSEVDPVHAGKTMRITLFDPGEGGSSIKVRRPSGTDSWEDATFSWTSDHPSYPSDSNTTVLDVSSSRFNGRTITIDIDLEGYSPPADNEWWQISYNFGSGSVTDRSTWSVNIIGDPVHLVE
ncbi:MAG: Tad domain-containing protein [Acidimicrobiia bacterium]|nr:Tad domain-containing protein [Acidimicrobiia bacterium]